MTTKILKWFFLSLAVSFLPFACTALALLTSGVALTGDHSIPHFWEHGEMCLIAISLVAAGIGDIATSKAERLKGVKNAVMFCSIIFLLAVVAWYGEISAYVSLNQKYDLAFIREKTPYLLIFGFIAGLACVLLSKET